MMAMLGTYASQAGSDSWHNWAHDQKSFRSGVPLRAANSDTSQSARSLTYIQISPHESRPCRGSGNEPPVSMSMLSAAKASQLTISVGPIGLSCFENGRSAGKRMNTPGDRIWSVACHPAWRRDRQDNSCVRPDIPCVVPDRTIGRNLYQVRALLRGGICQLKPSHVGDLRDG